jgi:hypothetical protein
VIELRLDFVRVVRVVLLTTPFPPSLLPLQPPDLLQSLPILLFHLINVKRRPPLRLDQDPQPVDMYLEVMDGRPDHWFDRRL